MGWGEPQGPSAVDVVLAENGRLRRLVQELWGDLDDVHRDWWRGEAKRRQDPDLDLLVAIVGEDDRG